MDYTNEPPITVYDFDTEGRECYIPCPETGLKIQRYISTGCGDEGPRIPKGYVIFDEVKEPRGPDHYLKLYEDYMIRRIGTPAEVLKVRAEEAATAAALAEEAAEALDLEPEGGFYDYDEEAEWWN